MLEIFLFMTMLSAAWFWLDSLNARSIAIDIGRQSAKKYGLQLLDETVAITRLWIARDDYDRVRLERIYSFEVSDTGTNRLSCTLVLLGKQLKQLNIPPHRDYDIQSSQSKVTSLFH